MICPNCNTEYEGNFCTECGMGRPLAYNEKHDGVVVEDLLGCVNFVGKSYLMNGIPEDACEAGDLVLRTIHLTGMVFGNPAEGRIIQPVAQKIIEQIVISFTGMEFMACAQALAERFGAPTERGMEPFSPVNGGAKLWFVFATPKATIRLSSPGSGETIELCVRLKK